MRETYDTNVATSNQNNGNNGASLETSLSPSVLVDFPMDESEFTGRYTYELTLYENATGSGGNSNTLENTHELVAQYKHSFSERYDFGLGEQFRYYTEPSIFDSTGTAYRSGAYYQNLLNVNGDAQLTPLLSTSATFSNAVVKYQDALVAQAQDSIEDTLTPQISFAVLPNLGANIAGTFDNITYTSANRGYTTYTLFGGPGWQVLPSLKVNGSLGASYTETPQSTSSITPYAALALTWTLGERSSLDAAYSHQVAPNDNANSEGQVVDRLSGTFRYDINPSITVHTQFLFNYTTVSQSLIVNGSGQQAYTENEYDLNLGGSYHINSHFDFETGYSLTGISSDIPSRDYVRNQVYVGIRGTY